MSTYVVTDTKKITPSTLLLTLKHTEGQPLLFQPGQYAAIHGYRKNRPMPIRCFSIVSSPTEQEILQFSMRVRGRFTRATAALTPGQKVHVQGPYGGFVLNTELHKRVVLLAGGIGITPFMSMIRFATVTQSDTVIDLLYSVASQDDVPFGEELLSLQTQNTNFLPTFVVDQGPADKYLKARTGIGRITPELLQRVLGQAYQDPDTVFYICGPPPFMRGMLQMLHSNGIPKSHIMTEAFSQGPNRQTGKVRDWPFSMYALGAVGLSAASLTIMINDLRSVLPPKNSILTAPKLTAKQLANSRQTDLDALLNSLPAPASTAPPSPAVQKAMAASKQTTTGSTGTKTTPVTTPTPVVTPTPTPTPTCTTTQSGVLQC